MTVEKKVKKNYGGRTFICGGITFLNCVKTVFPISMRKLKKTNPEHFAGVNYFFNWLKFIKNLKLFFWRINLRFKVNFYRARKSKCQYALWNKLLWWKYFFLNVFYFFTYGLWLKFSKFVFFVKTIQFMHQSIDLVELSWNISFLT